MCIVNWELENGKDEFKKWFANSYAASIKTTQQALGPRNCQIQGYNGCQINRSTEMPYRRPLMTWPPMMINWECVIVLKVSCPIPISMHAYFFYKQVKFFKFYHSLSNFVIGTKLYNQVWDKLTFLFWEFEMTISSSTKGMTSIRGVVF